MNVYRRQRADLIRKHLGRFILIADGAVKGDYGSAAKALATALKRYDEGEFIIKQAIDPDPDIHEFANPYVRPPA